MTLVEVQNLFGVSGGIFYKVLKNKTDLEMLEDAGQSISTFACPQGRFILVAADFSHPDYIKVE